MHAGNVILEPHLPPRDKKVKHSLQPRLKPDGKALDRVHLAHKSAENTAILKPVSNSIDEKFNYYRLARTVQRDSLHSLLHYVVEIYYYTHLTGVDVAERKYNQSSKDERSTCFRETDQ
jgi:hypothetical protein